MNSRCVADFFSCVGAHAIGLEAAGFSPFVFVEISQFRQNILRERFPGVPIHDDIRTFKVDRRAYIAVGGPPCQRTSTAAAIQGKRTGQSLWPAMLRACLDVDAEWIVVEQPPGNAPWERKVARSLARAGYHSARFEFSAADIGAPHQRRRVFVLAHRRLPRLALAWAAGPSALARVARSAAPGNRWIAGVPRSLRVDDRAPYRLDRRDRIEAIGDSNPPGMMEVIGHCISAADTQ